MTNIISPRKFREKVVVGKRVADFPKAFAASLESAIERGDLDEDQQLPPVTTLANHYDVSDQTIRNGLASLVNRGVLGSRRGPGGGYWVQRRDDIVSAVVDDLMARVKATGIEPVMLASALITRLPAFLTMPAAAEARAGASALVGSLRAGISDLAEGHDDYLDDAASR